jgi:hypothetical protein
MLSSPVRGDHKSHACIHRQKPQNIQIGFQSPGRASQTYHAKIAGGIIGHGPLSDFCFQADLLGSQQNEVPLLPASRLEKR